MYSRVRHTKNVDLCHASGTQSVIQIVAGLKQEHRLGIHVSRVCTVLGRQGSTDWRGPRFGVVTFHFCPSLRPCTAHSSGRKDDGHKQSGFVCPLFIISLPPRLTSPMSCRAEATVFISASDTRGLTRSRVLAWKLVQERAGRSACSLLQPGKL